MEVVVRAPRRIADSIEDVTPFAFSDFYPPQLDGAEDAVRKSTMDKAVERYGDPLPEIVTKRLDKELGSHHLQWVRGALLHRPAAGGQVECRTDIWSAPAGRWAAR